MSSETSSAPVAPPSSSSSSFSGDGPLTALARQLLANAIKLDSYTARHAGSGGAGGQQVTIENDLLQSLPADLETSRREIVQSSRDLMQLASGPAHGLIQLMFSFTDLFTLRFLHSFRLPQAVPLDRDVAYTEIAQNAGLDVALTRRVIQHAITNGIFFEPSPEYVRHTAISRMLHEDPTAMDAVGFLMNDMHPSVDCIVDAMAKFPAGNSPVETGFNIAHKTSDGFYGELAKTPERARRFGGGMRWMTRGHMYDLARLMECYDWHALDRQGVKIVDVGGGHGGVSTALAKATQEMVLIVQDLPGTAAEGEKLLPAELKGRVEFMAHDFLTPQPVHGAQVYFFRFILHNWPDEYVVRILKNLLPALVDGSRILIYEFVPSSGSNTSLQDKHTRNLDIIAWACFNSSERTLAEWQRLFALVDNRFWLQTYRSKSFSPLVLLEAVYKV